MIKSNIEAYFDRGGTIRETPLKNGEVLTQRIFTITGLSLWLGFSTKQALIAYGRDPVYREVVEEALTRIESEYEEMLHTGNSTSAQFALKQFGWKDDIIIRSEQDGMDRFVGMSNEELIAYQKQLARELLSNDAVERIPDSDA